MRLESDSPRSIRGQRAAAIIVVMVLLAVMVALIACNSRILHSLKAELKLVEEKQQKKFAPDFPTARTKPSARKAQEK